MKKNALTILILAFSVLSSMSQSEIDVTLGGFKSGDIVSSEDILKVDSIKVSSASYADSLIIVVKYDFVYQPLKKRAVHIKGTNALFTSEMKATLENTSYGDKVMITNIQCAVSNLGLRKLKSGIVITLK